MNFNVSDEPPLFNGELLRGVGTTLNVQHYSNSFHPSLESFDSSGSGPSFSKSYTSLESAGSRLSWSSGDLDWAQRGAGGSTAELGSSYRILQQQNADLTKQVFIWKAKYDTLENAYNLLLERIPATTSSGISAAYRKPLDPADYPQIDFWFRHQWTPTKASERVTEINEKAEKDDDEGEVFDGDSEDIRPVSPIPGAQRGQGRSRAGINVAMRYIQNKHGEVIDGHRARDIRIHARALFVGFARQERLFNSWGDADADTRKTFYNEMATRFEELQYCDLDWKAEQIATDVFPGWKSTWSNKQKKIQQEVNEKRARHNQQPGSEEPIPKRSKVQPATDSELLLSEPSNIARSNLLSAYEIANDVPNPIPTLNIIPNTPAGPARINSESTLNLQGPDIQRAWNGNSLRPDSARYHFSIKNPLANGVNNFTPVGFSAATCQTEKTMSATPDINPTALPSQLAPEKNNGTRTIPAAAKRLRPGTTKMRPSKTSTTARNLCALQWTASNPKGTAEEFSTYYDRLSAEEKEKWDKLSAEAKGEGKTA